MLFKVCLLLHCIHRHPQGVFGINFTVSGIFFLHPVRHSCLESRCQANNTHTHTQPWKTQCWFSGHTDTPPVWLHLWSDTKEGSKNDALPGSWGAPVSMVTLMALVCSLCEVGACVCVYMCEDGGRREWESEVWKTGWAEMKVEVISSAAVVSGEQNTRGG